jgi:hypothetical protein
MQHGIKIVHEVAGEVVLEYEVVEQMEIMDMIELILLG